MDNRDFYRALLSNEEKNDEWTASAEHKIRLQKLAFSVTEEGHEFDASEPRS